MENWLPLLEDRLETYFDMLSENDICMTEEAAAAVERVAEYITEHGGSVSEQEGWGVRRLAYPIRRYQEGNYMLTQFQLDSKDVGELDRRLNASQDVLTHLVTKVDKSAK